MTDYLRKLSVLIFLFAIFASYPGEAKPLGINDEGCVGDFEQDTLAGLRLGARILAAEPTKIVRCDDSTRCDGGFSWQPFLVNQERAWFFYTRSTDDGTVLLNVRNICSQHLVIKASFRNEAGSPNLRNNSAYALGTVEDSTQTLFKDYDRLILRLYQDDLGSRISLFGLLENSNPRPAAVYLDDFAVEAL